MSVNFARNSWNTVVLPVVKVYFRRFPHPGREGTQGAIQRAPYVLQAETTSISGFTDGEGAIPVRIPAGQTVRLEIFGTTYELSLRGSLEPVSTVMGVKRRLNMLGYRAGVVDGLPTAQADYSLLNYQGDHASENLNVRGFQNDGTVDPATRDSLRNAAGE